MQRQVEPEWLDQLPPENPRAIASRHDLRRLNYIMGHARRLARILRQSGSDHQTLIELGAGDGTLLLQILRSLPQTPHRQILLVDRLPAVTAETRRQFERLNCDIEVVTRDVFDWLENADTPADSSIIANLFLHHFDDAHLTRLLRLIAARCRFFAACEPRRSQLPLVASRLIGLIGCNQVTRHDAVISVIAGFHGDELKQLWPGHPNWTLTESFAPPFSHQFSAVKASA